MRKSIVTLALSACIFTAYGQLKLGNNPSTIDPSSLLELESTNKAFYNVRVSLISTTDVTTIPSPKAGMSVYNTNASISGTTPNPATPGGVGMYYYDGSRWVGAGATASRGIIVLTNSNYNGIQVPSNSHVTIEGNISLTYNYGGLNSNSLVVNGGSITGNGTTGLTLGFECVFVGVSFDGVDIGGNESTFINCSFSGNCPRLGANSRFYGCDFSNLTTGSTYILGPVVNSTLYNCILQRCTDFTNTEIYSSTIGYQGGVSNISSCSVEFSYIHALTADFVFIGNRCTSSTVYLSQSHAATIANNQFNSGVSSGSAPVTINPSAAVDRLYTIQNNTFSMSGSDNYCIDFVSASSSSSMGIVAIKSNTFSKATGTGDPVHYQPSLWVDYTGNTAYHYYQSSGGGTFTVSSPNFTHP